MLSASSKFELRQRVLERLHGSKVSKAHQKQALVLDGFSRCLFEKGLVDSSFAAVAKFCGMKPSHINYYFPTWEDMLESCFRFVIATAQEITLQEIARAATPEASLQAICDAPFLHLKLFPDHAAVLSAYQMECTRQKRFRKLQRAVRLQGRERIKEILRHLEKNKSSSQLDILALQIQSTIIGYVTEWSIGRENDSSHTVQKQTWLAVRAILSPGLSK